MFASTGHYNQLYTCTLSAHFWLLVSSKTSFDDARPLKQLIGMISGSKNHRVAPYIVNEQ